METSIHSQHNPTKTPSGANPKALDGVKVLEWAQLVAGPYCGKLLADLGAEVIKVEKPGLGDEARRRGPFVRGASHPERSLLFLYLNTNKLGITLDIKNTADREKFVELAKWADIVIEDNPPQTLERLRLTHQDLRKLNPRLITTSITSFGQTGPYSDYKAYPINIYNSGGLGYLSPRMPEGSVQSPIKPGGFLSECACGLMSAVGTLAALYTQRLTGLGQRVDISKQEAILALCRVQMARYPNEGLIQSRLDDGRVSGGIYQCKDGYVIVIVTQSPEWRALAKLVGNSKWERDERYMDVDFRAQHRKEIDQHISIWMRNRTKEEIYHEGQALGCPISPVMTARDILNSAQSTARQFFTEVAHPVSGKLKYPTVPYHFSVTPSTIERPAPLLGQHTQQVFSKLPSSNAQDPTPAEATTQTSRQTKGEGKGPLQGIKIADFSWAWAGSHCTELLAFLGAEVVKVESLKHIDFTRLMSFTTGQKFEGMDESPVFNDVNLNKLSIRLDLSQPRAIDLAKRLVSISDVVVQNMRPGVMERLGLGYEALKKVKPDIVYLSSSARGAIGPERKYSGYASNFGASGGISHITGIANGKPAFMAGEIDLLSAITSAFAILVALNHRLATGEGQHIDLSSSEAMSVLIGEVIMDYTANGTVQTREGNLDEVMVPHNCYRCKGEDKWISIAIATDTEWEAFCKVLGNPDWTRKQSFLTASTRRQNQEGLDKLIAKWTINHSHYEIMEMLQQVGVAAMPCFDAKEIFDNPHLNHRHYWTKVAHPVMGELAALACPWKFSATPAKISSAAPMFGQHSDYIFKELLGMRDDKFGLLQEEKVIY
ncbi:MAG: CoA transferase [Dehalococcoidia bacterium]|nr:CoA transferase [Dehalococcoidia bacterium]